MAKKDFDDIEFIRNLFQRIAVDGADQVFEEQSQILSFLREGIQNDIFQTDKDGIYEANYVFLRTLIFVDGLISCFKERFINLKH